MRKFFICTGILLQISVFLINRVNAPLSDTVNILVGLFCSILIGIGLFYKDVKIDKKIR